MKLLTFVLSGILLTGSFGAAASAAEAGAVVSGESFDVLEEMPDVRSDGEEEPEDTVGPLSADPAALQDGETIKDAEAGTDVTVEIGFKAAPESGADPGADQDRAGTADTGASAVQKPDAEAGQEQAGRRQGL